MVVAAFSRGWKPTAAALRASRKRRRPPRSKVRQCRDGIISHPGSGFRSQSSCLSRLPYSRIPRGRARPNWDRDEVDSRWPCKCARSLYSVGRRRALAPELAHFHYSHGNIYNHDPLRPRKLLVHKQQLAHLIGKSHRPGITIVPLRLYDRKGKIKLEIGVARGKRQYDKREAIAERDAKREMDRAIKQARAAV